MIPLLQSKEIGPFGRVVGEDNNAYHAHPALSKSKLDDFIESPQFFRGRHITREYPREETKALEVGDMLHKLMELGVEEFDRRYVVSPDFGPLQSSTNRAKRDKWLADHPGVSLIKQDDRTVVFEMRESLLRHPEIRQLIENAECEITWRAKPENLPFAVQCRTDVHSADGCAFTQRKPYVLDFKSIKNLSHGDFRYLWNRAYWDYRYFIQDVFYLSVIGLCGAPADDYTFYFAPVEKEPPYACALFTSDEIGMGAGRLLIRRAIDGLLRSLEHDEWPTLPTGLHTCTVSPRLLETIIK
ncbi:MAG: PD-(D/E)XK nuclease-like domain-containing protein [Opitutus sp.]|nr:PD-(D/E)XK nuclease-like domain-containing protein [Opitutus sp.]